MYKLAITQCSQIQSSASKYGNTPNTVVKKETEVPIAECKTSETDFIKVHVL